MCHRARTPFIASALAFLTFAGCSQSPAPFAKVDHSPKSDHEAKFDPPATYPAWAYDAPSYVKPVDELRPAPKAKPSDPLHYFTKDKTVMVRQPSAYRPEEIPRVAIWWTNNNGFHWHKAGYFGREQGFFPFEAEEDGDYGVRFVGPGQEQAAHATAYPERVYHVDTVIPEVEVKIDPEQSWYNVGQSITISWRAEDYHLLETPVSITALLDFSANEPRPIEIHKGLAAEGSITYEIPADFIEREVRIRVDALDRADNLGIAYSPALQIVTETKNPQLESPAEDQSTSIRASSRRDQPPASPDGRAALNPTNPIGDMFAALGSESLTPTDATQLPADSNSRATTPASSSIRAALEGPLNPAKLLPFATAFARKADANAGHPPEASQRSTRSAARMDGGAAVEGHPAEAASIAGSDEKESTNQDAVLSDSHTRKRSGDPAAQPGPDRVDLTCGNGLLIPLPGTVPADERPSRWALAHPWRLLRHAIDEVVRTVWAMPRTRPGIDPIADTDGRFLADHSKLRDVIEPTAIRSAVVSLPGNPSDAAPSMP